MEGEKCAVSDSVTVVYTIYVSMNWALGISKDYTYNLSPKSCRASEIPAFIIL